VTERYFSITSEMASAVSHAVAALGIGAAFYRRPVPKRVWIAGIACSMIPDLDVIGFRFGIHYGDFWGHRGFTHSLVFAAILAGLVMFLLRGQKRASSALIFSCTSFWRQQVTDCWTR